MADGLLDMIIQSADFDDLTASPNDVLMEKKFIGHDGIIQEGTMLSRESPTIFIPLNGSVTLPEGNYTGGEVKQNIATMNGYSVTPGSKQITIPTKDRYMTDDIHIESLTNLKPENIKFGEYVGGVGPGTWKGYIVTDPYTLYYRGTFGPGQKITAIPRFTGDYVVNPVYEDRDIFIQPTIYTIYVESIYIFRPVDITTKSKLKIQYSLYRTSPLSSTCCLAKPFLTEYNPVDLESTNTLIKDNLFGITDFNKHDNYSMGYYFSGGDPYDGKKKYEAIFDISAFSRNAYFSLYSIIDGKYGSWIRIHSVKFE